MKSRALASISPAAFISVLGAFACCDTTAATSEAHSAGINAPPVVRPELARQIAPGVTIIPDPRINFVPNIGFIEGHDAVLVIDTGLGAENGRRVWEFARKRAGKRKIYLTTTHIHPEHAFGAQAFKPGATIVLNTAQAQELTEKGPDLLNLFSHFGPDVAAALIGTSLVTPDQTYSGQTTLELGGRTVILRELPAHTRGDQVVFVPDAGILFTGDLSEERFFPVMPDADAKGARWIEVTNTLEAMQPQTVVPGHGGIGSVGLVRTTGEYLSRLQHSVQKGVSSGLDQDRLIAELTPQFKSLHPDWDNAGFIPHEIAVFYAEATGKPPVLPALGR